MHYSYKKLHPPELVALQDLPPSSPLEAFQSELTLQQGPRDRHPKASLAIFTMISTLLLLLTAFSLVRAGLLDFAKRQATTASTTSTEVPQYFQTTPEIYAGENNPMSDSIGVRADLTCNRTHCDWKSTLLG